MDIAIVLALLPALFWGSVGIVATKIGGSASQQTLGISAGALLFGLVVMFGYVIPNGFYLGPEVWVVGIISIALVVTGAFFISTPDKSDASKPKVDFKSMLYLTISTAGFMIYFVLPNFLAKVGYISSSVRTAGNGLNYMTALLGLGSWSDFNCYLCFP